MIRIDEKERTFIVVEIRIPACRQAGMLVYQYYVVQDRVLPQK